MKRIQIILTSAALFALASCSSTRNISSTPDDVYYSTSDPQYEPQPAAATAPPADYSRDYSNYNPDNNTNYSQDPSSTDQYSDAKGNTYITNNYNNSDDYYDYEYSARLRRYYTPAVGYGYYDPFYTNTYWYDYNPYNYGVSIYLGFNWWAPAAWYYTPFYYPPVYNPYYYPHYNCYTPFYGYYGNPYPYYGYGYGYNDGYCNGYYNGYYASAYNNPYYYNSYEGSSAYYGPRGSISSNVATTSPSPRASIGEKYQKATEQVIPVMGTKSTFTTSPVTGTVRPGSSTIAIDDAGKQSVSPVVPVSGKNQTAVEPVRQTITDKSQNGINPVVPVSGKNQTAVEPVRQSISDKNQNGTKPVVDPSAYSTGHNNTSGVVQTPRTNGGSVRPEVEQPSKSNNIDYSRPRNLDVHQTPQTNRGGTVRPDFDQSINNQQPRSNSTQPRNYQQSQPRNLDNNQIGQPRIENTTPRNINPRAEQQPRIEQQRVNPSYERPRQEVQPKIEPRQEPRQYKQERSQPKQNETISTPAPRQQNMSAPSQHNNNSSGDSKGGGRRK